MYLRTSFIQVWQLSSEDSRTSKFVVEIPSGQDVMSRSQYEMRFQQQLEELAAENPKQAKQLLIDNPEQNADLYRIGMGSSPQDYPSLILSCDQMQMLLNRSTGIVQPELTSRRERPIVSRGDRRNDLFVTG